jgi:DNA-binding NarL/FixJ family response regulator
VDKPIRIVLADDHPVVRIGVRNMLSENDGFDVVGEATDGDEAITQTLELEPDILLLDLQMPRLPGLEAMRAIMNGTPTVKILLPRQNMGRDHRGRGPQRPGLRGVPGARRASVCW